MKILGIQTADFAVYYDLVQALRARRLPFVTVSPGERVPPHVGALITTSREVGDVSHENVVVFKSPDATIDEALHALEGAGPFQRCIIGIDPGERPGIAVLADGRVLRLVQAASPEAVRAAVEGVLATVPAERFVVRMGHGAPTLRDRILHAISSLGATLELVDESNSTPIGHQGTGARDTQAALSIALTPGNVLRPSDVRPVRPTEGELRDIQRKSRLHSSGAVTISRSLARHVALGRLTLDEAIQRQQGVGRA